MINISISNIIIISLLTILFHVVLFLYKYKTIKKEKSPSWKQPTPGMQIKAILSSLQGHKSNYDEGITTKENLDIYFELHTKELFEISEILDQHNVQWKE